MIPWKNKGTSISKEDLNSLRDHKGVRENTFEMQRKVSSFNFTRKVFWDKLWDSTTIKARGLFIDDNDNIVARGYEKFFNLGERQETSKRYLEDNLKFPLNVYNKENGFFGVVGIVENDFFISSKSNPESDFSGWFRDIFNEQVSKSDQEFLLNIIKTQEICLTFEVIDPINDPHIIKYQKPEIILLDILHRGLNFEFIPYSNVRDIAKLINVRHKHLHGVISDKNAFRHFLDHPWEKDKDGNPIEGFVVEDQNGFMFKIKLDFYSFWKQMRSVKDRVLKIRGTNQPLKREYAMKHELAKEFHSWCQNQDDHILAMNIIDVRNLFISDGGGKEHPELIGE